MVLHGDLRCSGAVGAAKLRARMWSTVYASPWHHPGIAWAAVVVGALLLATRLRFLAGYLVVFGVALAADALASAPFTRLPSAAGTALGVTFVIAGDLRFFLLVERCASQRGLDFRAFALAVGSAFMVPLTSTAIRLAVPAVAETARLQYLVYEGLFVLLALAWRFVVLPARLRSTPPEVRRWALGLATFVLGQYVLWVVADVLLLAGHDAAFALRLVPNVLYYALFLPFVYVTAPAEEKSFR